MYMQPSTKGSACEMIFHKKNRRLTNVCFSNVDLRLFKYRYCLFSELLDN
jgi:hypothetical protein